MVKVEGEGRLISCVRRGGEEEEEWIEGEPGEQASFEEKASRTRRSGKGEPRGCEKKAGSRHTPGATWWPPGWRES